MARNRGTIKATHPHHTKSKVKVVQWETRVLARGIRDIPVEVRTTASRSNPKKMVNRQSREENNNAFQGEAAPQPMDVDESFWVEEPAIPTSEKRVRQLLCS